MIRYISSKAKNPDVEEIMNRISSYIRTNNNTELMDNNLDDRILECSQKLQQVNEIYEVDARKQIIVFGRFGKLKLFIKRVLRKCMAWYVQEIVDQQNLVNASMVNTINELKLYSDELKAYIDGLKGYADNLKEETDGIHSTIDRMSLKIENTNPFSDEWYVAFENIYRGTENDIRKRNERYLKWFAGMSNVLDLGCGRGEFLDLLRENGIKGRGIDLNKLMLAEALKKGLNVYQGDCIQFLEKQEDGTVDGIFAGQLVEHLNLNELVSLVKLAYSKLMKNGILVIETVNPMALGVFCYGFYIDSTHSIPVHPSSFQFIAQQVGFSIDVVEFAEEFPEEYKIQLTDDMDEGIKAGFEKINQQIYGAQDYYIVCRKRENNE